MVKKKNKKEIKDKNDTFEYPNISILMPTYNRNRFLKLVLINIYNMDYDKNKIEWVIFDDGKEPFFKNKEEENMVRELLQPMKIKYIYDISQHYKIGDKRNKLVKFASNKICIFMDDDDIYYKTYIKHSVETLKNKKAGLVGSNAMLFTYPHHNYNMCHIQCSAKRQIHEATMCFTKNYFRQMPGFLSSSLGEGAKMIDHNECQVAYTDITKCMICVPHNDNTFNKEQFYRFKTSIRFTSITYLDILYEITGFKFNKELSDIEYNNFMEEMKIKKENINMIKNILEYKEEFKNNTDLINYFKDVDIDKSDNIKINSYIKRYKKVDNIQPNINAYNINNNDNDNIKAIKNINNKRKKKKKKKK
jgi:glycosyltransferase involved in cell wall biosynthesis